MVVTHRCNLRCSYCYEARKDSRSMSEDTALRVMEREFALAASSSDVDELLFDFLGGEPFLEFGLIRRLAERTWSELRPVPYLFSATTNGTVLDDDAKAWLRAHSDRFKVVLSLDGVRSAQETNRPGSYGAIDMDFFREVYADQPVKMTVSPETVGSFAEGVTELVGDGFCVAPSFAWGAPWTEHAIREYGRQLGILARWFLDHPGHELIPQFQKRLCAVLDEEGPPRLCGTGRRMATYDVDGRAYPCHMFLPWITGRSDGFESVWGDDGLSDARCAGCSIVRVCKHCYGFNFIENGDPSHRSDYACRLMREEVKACVLYKGTLLGCKVRRGERLSGEELAEARAIVCISENRPKGLADNQETNADE